MEKRRISRNIIIWINLLKMLLLNLKSLEATLCAVLLARIVWVLKIVTFRKAFHFQTKNLHCRFSYILRSVFGPEKTAIIGNVVPKMRRGGMTRLKFSKDKFVMLFYVANFLVAFSQSRSIMNCIALKRFGLAKHFE